MNPQVAFSLTQAHEKVKRGPRPTSSPPKTSLRLKSYPELNREILRRRQARPGGFWLLARAIDVNGEGRVRVKDLRRAACKYMHCHRQTVSRALRKQTDFWLPTRQPGWIRYRGARQLALAWNIDLKRRPVHIDLTELSTLKRLRSALRHSEDMEP